MVEGGVEMGSRNLVDLRPSWFFCTIFDDVCLECVVA